MTAYQVTPMDGIPQPLTLVVRSTDTFAIVTNERFLDLLTKKSIVQTL